MSVYLIDDTKPGELVITKAPGLTPLQRKEFKLSNINVLKSFPLSLVIAIVNGFLESSKIPIRLISVGDGA